MHKKFTLGVFSIIGLILLAIGLHQGSAVAVDTTPEYIVYEGRLLDAAGSPITTVQTIRFSIWTDSDYIGTGANASVTSTGAINTNATNYGGWQEVHSLTPGKSGIFSVRLGSNNPLPSIIFTTHKFLQVEVKPYSDPDTDYELMDPTGDGGSDTKDRQAIGSSPYAKNSDRLDDHELGVSSGSVALLGEGDRWAIAQIPGGTNADTFVIDNDNTIQGIGTGSITLQFGNTLGKYISYDTDHGYFDFNDNVNIQGDLTISGTISGATIDGDDNTFQDIDWSAMKARTGSILLIPAYPGFSIAEDGTGNKATLELGTDTVNNHNYYILTSRETASLNDLDIYVRVQLPHNFVGWKATPIQIYLKTDSGSMADNQLDFYLNDTSSGAVALIGSEDLVSSSGAWLFHDITFGSGSFVWTPGEFITIRLNAQSRDRNGVYIGEIVLNYETR